MSSVHCRISHNLNIQTARCFSYCFHTCQFLLFLTFATAKVQQISDIRKHLHKKTFFFACFLVYQHVKDQVIINGLVGFSIILYNIKTGAKLQHFYDIHVEKSTFFEEFSPFLLCSVCKTAIFMLFSIYYAGVGRPEADVRQTWGRRRPKMIP